MHWQPPERALHQSPMVRRASSESAPATPTAHRTPADCHRGVSCLEKLDIASVSGAVRTTPVCGNNIRENPAALRANGRAYSPCAADHTVLDMWI